MKICFQAGYEEVLGLFCFLTGTCRNILMWYYELKKSMALLEEGLTEKLF